MAKDKGPDVVEKTVRFRFNQHCFIEGAEGVMCEVRMLPPDVAERLKQREVGEILPDEVQEVPSVQTP